MASVNRIALVTGGNKGIGFAICKMLAGPTVHVIMGSRSLDRGSEAVKQLNDQGIKNVECVQLDVEDTKSIEKCVKDILDKHKKIDILINNAGIVGNSKFGTSFVDADFNDIQYTFNVNTLGPLRLCQLIVPVMKSNNYGRIVNVSSGAGQLTEMNGKNIQYRISKVALNCITRVVNDEMKDLNIIANSMCPGFVKTDLTKGAGKKTPEEGADTAIWLATLPDDGPRGGFFRDRKPLAW